MEVAIIPPGPPPVEPSAFKLERKLPDHHQLKPAWEKFCHILQGEEFGFTEEALQQFSQEFSVCVHAVEAFNHGEQ